MDNVAPVGDRQRECHLSGDVQGPPNGKTTSSSDELGDIRALDKFERDVELAVY